ncbi:MAG: carboxymuconolactone decarboxylase family protein [Solirubrobacteraceae bacterium]|nr:carboxymuconolactone decarboxylase family protein [Patulibacter sp.]
MSTTTQDPTTTEPYVAVEARLPIARLAPAASRAMLELSRASSEGGVGHTILELVKTRVSQINGCAYCLDMHTLDARAYGETDQRLHTLAAWHDAPFFTARERAALGLAEAMTRIADGGVTDAVYAEAAAQFDEADLAQLIWAITVINGWNRIAITARLEAGHHTPRVAG